MSSTSDETAAVSQNPLFTHSVELLNGSSSVVSQIISEPSLHYFIPASTRNTIIWFWKPNFSLLIGTMRGLWKLSNFLMVQPSQGLGLSDLDFMVM